MHTVGFGWFLLRGLSYSPALQGGSILAMQEAALTTSAVKQSPLTVVAALPRAVAAAAEGGAGTQGPLRLAGLMYNDDGESLEVSVECLGLAVRCLGRWVMPATHRCGWQESRIQPQKLPRQAE